MLKQLNNFRIALLLLVLVIQGCANSGFVKVTENLDGYKNVHLKILPLQTSKDNIKHNDADRVSEYSPLSALIVSFNPDAYVYTFDAEDNMNFENSIFESLASSENFSTVEKVSDQYECKLSSDICLLVSLLSTEVHDDAFLSVSLKGVVQFFGNGFERKEFIIDSKGSGPFTVGQSKDGAMEDFIEKIYQNLK